MTVNELIEALKTCGDEKFRSTAEVRIVNDYNTDFDIVEPFQDEGIDPFNIKVGLNRLEIHVGL